MSLNNEFLRRCLLLSSTHINTNHYLTISSREDGLTVKFNGVDDIEYCINGKRDWNTLSSGSYTPAINAGECISFRGNLVPIDNTGIGNFTINKDCDLMGNCNSLLFGDYACETDDLSGYDYAFYELFVSCGTIINVSPNFIPATTLAKGCYMYMFWDCASLTTAPELPATTLAEYCYGDMFMDCVSLNIAPELPATTLAEYCYSGMFESTSLNIAPELPATTLAASCYSYMFNGCESLSEAPSLPATTLAKYCYLGMLQSCTSLTTAPVLPATTLADNCYSSMFRSCTSLTTAPVLPARTLANNCYQQMFYGCTKLNKITMYATNITATACLSNWVKNVATSGTFIKHPDMTSLPTGINGIPSGWTVVDDESIRYLTFEALENGLQVRLSYNASQYRIDNGDWINLGANASTPAVNIGHRIQFKIENPSISSTYGIGTFATLKKCNVFGNIMSLLYGDDFEGQVDLTNKVAVFYKLFKDCTNIISASNLILPATTLSNTCYSHMFYSCTSLTSAPALPATTLTNDCYSRMFQGCTSLTTSPVLPAKQLTPSCYSHMFYSCTSLNKITMYATNIIATACLSNWVSGVAKTGTFVKNATMPQSQLTIGVNGIPSGWIIMSDRVL